MGRPECSLKYSNVFLFFLFLSVLAPQTQARAKKNKLLMDAQHALAATMTPPPTSDEVCFSPDQLCAECDAVLDGIKIQAAGLVIQRHARQQGDLQMAEMLVEHDGHRRCRVVMILDPQRANARIGRLLLVKGGDGSGLAFARPG